jgi:vacuolar-type H+-ATPase subunit F/Vma7
MLRSIPLKPFGVVSDKEITTLYLLQTIIEAPKDGGFDYQSLSKTGKIAAALESAKDSGADSVKLDEALWQYLKERTAAMKWAFYHPAFIEIADDVNNAASVDPNGTPSGIAALLAAGDAIEIGPCVGHLTT